ncbi:sensor histidine kinase [Aquibacillus salsiterrae]|uniref:histidine kinase n=1 Tax=Aquibacillus salsiterrae TaxID=2950439 RepID=A0A9X3WGC8_9BACI|nr:ATP-binding protein [Aquibacillus salsiterrae]MDC3418143.1 cell wall metabolism sensor histidine kinase WalK [Aquibacillus salsiterrae]
MNKIVLKLGGTIMALFLVVLLPLGFVANQIFTNFYYNQVQQEISQLSAKYARNMTSLDDRTFIKMFVNLADLTNKEIIIINQQGEMVANSGVGLPHLSEKEVEQLSNGQSISKRVEDPVTNKNYLASGNPIYQGNKISGVFFVMADIHDIEEPVRKIRDLLILSAVGALFLALGFTFVLAKKMSDPLLEMEQATRKIAKGKLDVRVSIRSNDEIGTLAKAINDLAMETNRYRSNRREFFANISHELRTPISYLQGYAKVLKQGLYQSEKEKNLYLEIIDQESDRLVHLINDLFDLAKMEEGKIDLSLSFIDIGGILESAIVKLKVETVKKGIELEVISNNVLPRIKGDPIRMEQIFTNLLSNAVRYTEQGKITARAFLNKQHVHVHIEDTGMGIPEEEIPYIFERFHRVEKSRSRQLGGTGLGLAIVKNLVELHNGTIAVESRVGQGTTFLLSFPVERGAE